MNSIVIKNNTDENFVIKNQKYLPYFINKKIKDWKLSNIFSFLNQNNLKDFLLKKYKLSDLEKAIDNKEEYLVQITFKDFIKSPVTIFFSIVIIPSSLVIGLSKGFNIAFLSFIYMIIGFILEYVIISVIIYFIGKGKLKFPIFVFVYFLIFGFTFLIFKIFPFTVNPVTIYFYYIFFLLFFFSFAFSYNNISQYYINTEGKFNISEDIYSFFLNILLSGEKLYNLKQQKRFKELKPFFEDIEVAETNKNKYELFKEFKDFVIQKKDEEIKNKLKIEEKKEKLIDEFIKLDSKPLTYTPDSVKEAINTVEQINLLQKKVQILEKENVNELLEHAINTNKNFTN